MELNPHQETKNCILMNKKAQRAYPNVHHILTCNNEQNSQNDEQINELKSILIK
jgi:hypothetical protein